MIDMQAMTGKWVLGPPTAAATTTRSASFEFAGADYAVLRILQSAPFTAAGTNGGVSVSVLSADSVPTQATQFATLVADVTSQATTSHEVVYYIDLKTAKRYGKIILTPNTSSNDTVVTAAFLQLGRLENAPSGTSAMVGTTNDTVRIVTAPA
jgi:hypothetical protein